MCPMTGSRVGKDYISSPHFSTSLLPHLPCLLLPSSCASPTIVHYPPHNLRLKCHNSFPAAAKVQAAALRGWSLLLSTLPAWHLTAADIERQLASLAELLGSPYVEVRSAAGEAVALLFQTYGLSELDAGDPSASECARCVVRCL